MERIPKPGEFYRHFKDKLYQVITIAEHSETGEALVVYQALYGDFRTYARPLAMFVSEVDREKYPDVTQKYRFERLEPAGLRELRGNQIEIVDSGRPANPYEGEKETVPINPGVFSFIEAETYEDRLEALHGLKGNVSQEDLGLIYAALDLKPIESSVEAQLEAVERILSMQRYYDGGHLR